MELSNRTLYITEGVVFMLLGIGAIALPGFFTLSVALLLGLLLVIGGAFQLFHALTERAASSSSWWWGMLMSVLNIFVGLLFLIHPLVGVFTLTLLLMSYFILSGFYQIIWSFQIRHESGWWLMTLNGLIALLLAWIIFYQLPESAIWAIGLLLGINMLIGGMALLTIGWQMEEICFEARRGGRSLGEESRLEGKNFEGSQREESSFDREESGSWQSQQPPYEGKEREKGQEEPRQ